MKRGRFFKTSVVIITMIVFLSTIEGCFKVISTEPDVIFDGTDSDAKRISGLWPKLYSMAKNPGEPLKIGLLQGEEKMKVLSLWINDKGYLCFLDSEAGQVGSLRFGSKKLSPSIKVTDLEGNILMDGGKEMEYAFWGDKQGAPALTSINTGQWFLWATGAVAVGLGVWLVAKVGVFLLSALAFVAFNLMVLALLVAGAAIIYGAAKLFFGATGITADDVKNWFLGEVENLNIFIRQVAEDLGG